MKFNKYERYREWSQEADNAVSHMNTDFERLLSCHPESQRSAYRVGPRDASLRLSMTNCDPYGNPDYFLKLHNRRCAR